MNENIPEVGPAACECNCQYYQAIVERLERELSEAQKQLAFWQQRLDQLSSKTT